MNAILLYKLKWVFFVDVSQHEKKALDAGVQSAMRKTFHGEFINHNDSIDRMILLPVYVRSRREG